MLARLDALMLEIDLGENGLFYDEGSFNCEPLEKIESIYSSYGLNLEDIDEELYTQGCNNYMDSFYDENGRECFHIYYRYAEDEILHKLNRAHCESNFLISINKLQPLEKMLSKVFDKEMMLNCDDDVLVTNAAMYGVYHRDFKPKLGWIKHHKFMSAMKKMLYPQDYDVFKRIEKIYGK